jgi:hypothetical protein
MGRFTQLEIEIDPVVYVSVHPVPNQTPMFSIFNWLVELVTDAVISSRVTPVSNATSPYALLITLEAVPPTSTLVVDRTFVVLLKVKVESPDASPPSLKMICVSVPPTGPVAPVAPADPVGPEVPEVPEDPEVPLDPGVPFDPDVPDDPLVPEEPETPLVPEVPLDPAGPVAPVGPTCV